MSNVERLRLGAITHSGRSVIALVAFLCLCIAQPSFAKGEGKSDAEVKTVHIQKSIASYSGRCPCPYNRTSNGINVGSVQLTRSPVGRLRFAIHQT